MASGLTIALLLFELAVLAGLVSAYLLSPWLLLALLADVCITRA